MAAHALTLARQALGSSCDKDLLVQAWQILDAPGFDAGPGMEVGDPLYTRLYAAVHASSPRPNRVRQALREIVKARGFLIWYSNQEEADVAFRAFIRRGKPHWRKRHSDWFAGVPRAHAAARNRTQTMGHPPQAGASASAGTAGTTGTAVG